MMITSLLTIIPHTLHQKVPHSYRIHSISLYLYLSITILLPICICIILPQLAISQMTTYWYFTKCTPKYCNMNLLWWHKIKLIPMFDFKVHIYFLTNTKILSRTIDDISVVKYRKWKNQLHFQIYIFKWRNQDYRHPLIWWYGTT